MKIAHLTLIAALAAPCASHAEIIDRPGPFTVPKTQFACQNLADYDEIDSSVTLKYFADAKTRFTRRNNPESEARKLACITVRKGTKVIVKDRHIGKECVDIMNRPSTKCFYIQNVSGDKRPDYDPWYPW